MLSLCRTSLSLAYVHRIAVSMFEDILVGLTNTVSVSEARIQITLLIVRQSAQSIKLALLRLDSFWAMTTGASHFTRSLNPNTLIGVFDSTQLLNLSSVMLGSLVQLSSLRAESARAFTGRRCPHSGRGEDFLTGQQIFFTETAVTPERKVEKSFPRWEINRHAEG